MFAKSAVERHLSFVQTTFDWGEEKWLWLEMKVYGLWDNFPQGNMLKN